MKNAIIVILLIVVVVLGFALCSYVYEDDDLDSPTSIKPVSLYDTNTSRDFIEEVGGGTSWYCTELYGSQNKILLEVGYFNSDKYSEYGFVLYDGTNEGIITRYGRDGIDHRWDWGLRENNKFRYAFIIKPDGTGLYYDFSASEDGIAKARDVYKTRKR